MPDDEPPLTRRSVRDFCKHYGLTRPQFRDYRTKAKVRPNDQHTMLSVKDQKALLRYVSADRREAQQRSEWLRHVATTPVRPIKQGPPPEPPVDFEAQIETAMASLIKTRRTLVALTKDHIADDGTGRCGVCSQRTPCLTKRTLTELDRGLVGEIAVWGAGSGSDSSLMTADDPERRLQLLYAARNRWLEALVRLTRDHMNENDSKQCVVCNVDDPCGLKAAFLRINPGIAHRVANEFYIMDDEELRAAFHRRPRYARSDESTSS
ncbi:hypothetical protein KXR83_16615 [Williamsia muralis]|uniref:hypothetical protein n=1 Tax=Williamsia marianensis TaxID=85044 RepID=UPI003F153999